MFRRGTLAFICALLVLLGGCVKRQAPKSFLVYVPAPPPAATPPASQTQALVIEEPAPPPPPEENPAPAPPEPAAPRRPRRPVHSDTAAGPPENTQQPETPETPPAQVPALEPRESHAQESELRRQFLSLEQNIRQRLARLNNESLSPNDRRTLEDARTFLEQATRAQASGDLPRALNLARKASLLLAALE